MLNRRRLQMLGFGLVGLTLAVGMALAQPTRPGAGQGGRGGFGGRGQFNPEELRQRRMDRMKEELAASDDEWKVLEPRLSKVMSLQQEVAAGALGGFFGGRRGRGGFGGPRGFGGPGANNERELNATQTAMQALREVLDQDNPGAEEIKAKLTALRAAKESARQKLAAAQKELREVLTLKQEALLVLAGQLN